MNKITPHLWFDDKAEEAVNFYVYIFKNSKIINVSRYGEAGAEISGRPADSAMTVAFELEGQSFMALNGGPVFEFSPAISFVVYCENQDEVDHFWDNLSQGGQTEQCGWLKDRFGVSWQIVPTLLGDMMQNADRATTERVMAELLKMQKIDIDLLLLAYERTDSVPEKKDDEAAG